MASLALIFWRKFKNVTFIRHFWSCMSSYVFCSSFECVGVRKESVRHAELLAADSSILALLFKTNANQSALSTCDSLSLALPVFKETVTLISCSSSLFLCPPLTAVTRTIPTTPLKSHCLPNNYYTCTSQAKCVCQWNRITNIWLTPSNYFLSLFAFIIIYSILKLIILFKCMFYFRANEWIKKERKKVNN